MQMSLFPTFGSEGSDARTSRPARMALRPGLKGKQSRLFHEFSRLIRRRSPREFSSSKMFRVSGSSHGGRDFQAVVQTLAQLGYGVGWRVLNSRFFGAHSLGNESSSSDAIETGKVPERYFLSPNAARGMIRRTDQMGKAVSPFKEVIGNTRRGPVTPAHCRSSLRMLGSAHGNGLAETTRTTETGVYDATCLLNASLSRVSGPFDSPARSTA